MTDLTPDTAIANLAADVATTSTDPAPTPVDAPAPPKPTEAQPEPLAGRVGSLETAVWMLSSRVSSLETRPAAASPAAGGGVRLVTYEDYDYVTETTTVRHGVILDRGEQVNAEGDTEATLTVGWLRGEVTLPAAAFEQH